MTVYKCHSCGFYQTSCKVCSTCGVNNRMKESSDSEILGDIGNKLTRILTKWKEEK